MTGGYAATAASTGNGWGWRYYGEQGAGGIGTPSGPHNCTLYVAWRLQQAGMGDPGRSWGNASQWGSSFAADRRPAVGSVAWWSTGNHVAYVEQISADGTQVFVRADNYIPTGAGGYTDAGWISVNGPNGFLHIHDTASTSAYETAFEANTNNLWSMGRDTHGDWRQGMMPGTSPSIATLAGGGYEMAFQANTGELITIGSSGNRAWGLGMMAGTSPAITAQGASFEVAFQANTGSLWTVGADMHGAWGLGMAAGTSPAITALPAGGYETAFQANTGSLWTVGSSGNRAWGLGMMAGTSPAITAQGASFEVAFQANTGSLWTVGADMHGAWGLGMAAGTAPAIG